MSASSTKKSAHLERDSVKNFVIKIVLPVAIFVAGGLVALNDVFGRFSDAAMIVATGAAILLFALGSWEAMATLVRRIQNHLKLTKQYRRRRQVRSARLQRSQERRAAEHDVRVANGRLIVNGRHC